MIFPVLFYREELAPHKQNEFQEALQESLYVDKDWPGVACELSQISDCVVRPEQFGIDIFPAYVFLRRLPDDPEDAVMVKKIEGRYLETDEVLAEIQDSYSAVFDDPEGGVVADEDGDGQPDGTVTLPKQQYGAFGLGRPFGSLFNCGSFFPEWLCGLKMGYFLVLLAIIVLLVLVIAKKIR